MRDLGVHRVFFSLDLPVGATMSVDISCQIAVIASIIFNLFLLSNERKCFSATVDLSKLGTF